MRRRETGRRSGNPYPRGEKKLREDIPLEW
jgi:hypothetical protein